MSLKCNYWSTEVSMRYSSYMRKASFVKMYKIRSTYFLNIQNQPFLEVYAWLKMILWTHRNLSWLFGLDLDIPARIGAAKLGERGEQVVKGQESASFYSLWMDIAPWEKIFFDPSLNLECPLTSTLLRSHKFIPSPSPTPTPIFPWYSELVDKEEGRTS